jgi:hypothetical protein
VEIARREEAAPFCCGKRQKEVICPLPFSSVASILEISNDLSLQISSNEKRGIRMIRDATWRLGFLMGVLALLWTFSFPFLGQAGILPIHLSPANIGAGFLLIAPFGLMEFLMVLFVFFRSTRLLSFGLAVPLLVLQIGLIQLTFSLGPRVTFLINLPGCMALLVVGIAYYLNSIRYSRERLNTLESFNERER